MFFFSFCLRQLFAVVAGKVLLRAVEKKAVTLRDPPLAAVSVLQQQKDKAEAAALAPPAPPQEQAK
jgi:hypothetical protein